MVKLLLLLILIHPALSSEQKYCIQVATYKSLELAIKDYERVKEFPDARVEEREGVYLLRVGMEENSRNLKVMLLNLRKFFPDAFIKRCAEDPSYVVYPYDYKSPKKETDLSTLEEKVESLRKEVKNLSGSIKRMEENGEKEGEVNLDKYLVSAGILLGGLFLLTWVLIAFLYRKVETSALQNKELLGDILKATKILTLLSKGNILKMERGKLMVYDKKKDRWKEVEL